ncbi:MAG: hypothetical protein KAV87_63180 [Desulfobacteraceae bacterium]|nr:hypothetical protein [Desulfobacteraceae bacterium]
MWTDAGGSPDPGRATVKLLAERNQMVWGELPQVTDRVGLAGNFKRPVGH